MASHHISYVNTRGDTPKKVNVRPVVMAFLLVNYNLSRLAQATRELIKINSGS